MKYFRIKFLDHNETPGYMEVTDAMDFSRITDLLGLTLTPDNFPDPCYRTMDQSPVVGVDIPLWAL